MANQKIVLILLRLSIASVFLYAAISATLQPFNWIDYIPLFLRQTFPVNLLLLGFSAYQFVLAVWILSGWKNFFSASLAALTLVAIIIANISLTDILFRDFAIFFAAVALAAASMKSKNS